MTLGERVKHYREALGLSQAELARRAGFTSRSAINKIESGHSQVSISRIKPLAQALGVHEQRLLYDDEDLRKRIDPTMLEFFDDDLNALLNAADSMSVSPEMLGRMNDMKIPKNLIPIQKLNKHAVPVIGEVAAGQPILAEETHDMYVDGPEKADYALRVAGDSMKPTFLDGDLVYIKATPEVPNGTIAVVLIDDSATLKHVYRAEKTLTLISDNPKYTPMVIDLTEHEYVRILGVVVGFTRMFHK